MGCQFEDIAPSNATLLQALTRTHFEGSVGGPLGDNFPWGFVSRRPSLPLSPAGQRPGLRLDTARFSSKAAVHLFSNSEFVRERLSGRPT